jgi:dCTP diphosphatase
MPVLDLTRLQQQLRDFAVERDWDQFHSPKNLSMALIAEAAELVEHFQWLTEAQSQSMTEVEREKVALEIADIQIYLARIADKLKIDIPAAVDKKLTINADKYPKEKVSGSAKKYSDY